MTPTERQRIEKELYNHIDTFCGGRENHTPILIEQLISMIVSERDKARNQAIQDCIDIVSVTPGDENVIPKLESLKNNQLT